MQLYTKVPIKVCFSASIPLDYSYELDLSHINRLALGEGMDWLRMELPVSRVRKIFFRGRNLQETP